MSFLLRSLPSAQQPHVRIRDARRVDQVLQNMAAGGRAKLRVVSDFDQTLSRYLSNGRPVQNSIQVIAAALSDVGRERLKELANQYVSGVYSPTTSQEDKVKMFLEFKLKMTDLYVTANISRADFSAAIQNSPQPLREGCDIFMDILHKNDVPILVFSAGVVEVIQAMLEKNKLVHPNCEVVANFMKFDDEGKFVGWYESNICPFNKNKTVLDESYFLKEPERTNVLLLGDSVDDAQMVDGVPGVGNILKIGYLNGKMEKLSEYMELYDIVLVDDESMDVANAILKAVIGSP